MARNDWVFISSYHISLFKGELGMGSFYLERALFVVGDPNTGKSVQLRSMFRDIRFSTDGIIPTGHNLQETYRLSNDRSIYIRLTSPHENGENIEEFFDKILTKIRRPGRWNFAGPLQPNQSNTRMLDLVEIVEAFVDRFSPERLRVVFLSPDRNGDTVFDTTAPLDQLQNIGAVEVCAIDARNRRWNGLFLADFFDFT